MGFLLQRLHSDTPAKPKPVEIYNPYLAARKEWDERYGEFITRARNWRTVALISGLVAVLATGGLVWLTARSHVIPFVVLIDSLGRPVASALAEQTSVGDDRLRRAVIQDWIENVRLVTTDGIAQRRAIDRVYAHIASGTSAQAFISEFYRTIHRSSEPKKTRCPLKCNLCCQQVIGLLKSVGLKRREISTAT